MRPDISAQGIATAVEGPLLFLRRTLEVGLNEAVEVTVSNGPPRLGRIAAVDEERLVVEVLESTSRLGLADVRVRFLGEPLTTTLGPGLLGRIFDGVGRPIDGGPPVAAERRVRIDAPALNPAKRDLPRDFIETGLSAIDLMNALVRGQKLPLFSGAGLPHDRMVIDIVRHARLRQQSGVARTRSAGVQDEGNFAIVFVGIGIPHDSAEMFRRAMQESGALAHTVILLNLASEPSTQRLLAPRYALTMAEHLAYEEGRHVLVVMTDMTNYCEALREVSASHGEIPSRKGYPSYMYSDLASIFERAGCQTGVAGTVTQLPILTMPADDISHPIPDLTGYITEGQVVLDRGLDHRGVYPPINVLPSLSRLMDLGIGKGFTDADHPALASQLFASYARATRARLLSSVVGKEGLTPLDHSYLDFADAFEQELVSQPAPRALEDSFGIAWRLLAMLPHAELTRVSDQQVSRHLGAGALKTPEVS